MEQGSYNSGRARVRNDVSWAAPYSSTAAEDWQHAEEFLFENEYYHFDRLGFEYEPDSGSQAEAEAEAGLESDEEAERYSESEEAEGESEAEPHEGLDAAITCVLHAAAAAPRPFPFGPLRVLDRECGGGLMHHAIAATVSQAIQSLAAAAEALEFGGFVRKPVQRLAAALEAAMQPAEVVVLAEAAAALADHKERFPRVRSCTGRTRAWDQPHARVILCM